MRIKFVVSTISTWILVGLMFVLPSTVFAQANTWTKKTDMPTARFYFATSVVDGIIYAIGGELTNAEGTANDPRQITATVEAYNPATDSWTRQTDMPDPRFLHPASVVNGKIYVVGGARPAGTLFTVEEYDPVTDTWTRKANMPTNRCCLTTSVVNGKIYAIGGIRRSGVPAIATVEEYDPATDTWAKKADMPTNRRDLTSAVVNDKIYVIGGRGGARNRRQLTTVEEYDPATNAWTQKADMLTERRDLSASVVDGIIYVIGGLGMKTQQTDVDIKTVEAYDPATDTWTQIADMPTARSALSTSVVNGQIYAIGGHSDAEVFSVIEVFDTGITTSVSPRDKLAATWATIKQGR